MCTHIIHVCLYRVRGTAPVFCGDLREQTAAAASAAAAAAKAAAGAVAAAAAAAAI